MLRFRLYILENSSESLCYVTIKLGTMVGGENNVMSVAKREGK